MRKKKGRLLALLLAMVMVVSGLQLVPARQVNAAGEAQDLKVIVSKVTGLDKENDVADGLVESEMLEVVQDDTTFSPGDILEVAIHNIVTWDSMLWNFKFDPGSFDVIGYAEGDVKFDQNAQTIDSDSIMSVIYGPKGKKREGALVKYYLEVKETTQAFVSFELANFAFTVEGDEENQYEEKTEQCVDVTGTEFANGEIPITIPLNSMSFGETSPIAMARGTTRAVDLTASPLHALEVEGRAVKWTSTDNETVAVTGNGKSATLEAKKKGQATIKAECDGKSAELVVNVTVPLQSISLNKNKIELEKEKTEELTVTYNPEDADLGTVEWLTSNPQVATVNDGVVTAVGGGTAKITARVGDKTAECDVKVKVPLKDISLTDNATIEKRNTLQLDVTTVPADATDYGTVTWKSDAPAVADVNANGLVTAKTTGTAKITATLDGHTKECVITVIAPLKELSITPAKVKVLKDQKDTVNVTYNPTDTTDSKKVKWEINDDTIASYVVKEDGSVEVTGLREGTATLTVSSDARPTVKATCQIEVEEIHISGVTLNKTNLTLEAGNEETLTVIVAPANTTDDKAIAWSSSNNQVATVVDGKVTAVKGGTATITAATTNGKTATCTVKVPIHLTGISLNKNALEVLKGQTAEALVVSYAPAVHDDAEGVTWKSENTAIATVDQTGKVTGVKAGTVKITATSNTGSHVADCTVTVNEIPLTGISFGLNAKTAEKGTEFKLDITYTPSNTTDDKSAQWSSSKAAVATVDQQGNVRAVAPGTAVITADVNGKTATCTVTVTSPLKSLSISKSQIQLIKGKDETVSVSSFNPEDTTDSKEVEWTIDNNNVASIEPQADGKCKVFANAEGTATLTVTSKANSSIKAQCNVVVGEVHIESITVTPATLTLEKGQDDQLMAALTPAVVTDDPTINWTSSDASVVSVDQSGKVTAVKGGTATITATTSNGKTATCVVKVPVRLEGIRLDKTEIEVDKGKTSEALVVTYLPSNHVDQEGVTWSVDDGSIAKVEDGKVTGLSAGTVTVTATAVTGGFTATCQVKVIERPVESLNITLGDLTSPADPEKGYVILKGQAESLKPEVWPKDTTDEITYVYEVEDPTVVEISAEGVVKALNAGKTAVKVKVLVNGVENEKFAKVFEVSIEELHLEDAGISKETEETLKKPLTVGDQVKLEIFLNPEDTTDEIDTKWTSSDETVAAIENGVLTAKKAGKAVITVTVNGIEKSQEITVVEKTVVKDPVKDPAKDPAKDSVKKPTVKPAGSDKKDDAKSKAPSTGDSANGLVGAVAMISVLAIAFVAFMRRRSFR